MKEEKERRGRQTEEGEHKPKGSGGRPIPSLLELEGTTCVSI